MTNEIQMTVSRSTTVAEALRGNLTPRLVEDIAKRIGEAAVFRGFDIPKSDLTVMAQTYLADLKQYFPQLDLSEITTIIRSGIRKEYGEFYGLNAGTLYDWTCEYVKSPAREEYVARKKASEPKPPMLEQRNALSQADEDALVIGKINESYARYRDLRGDGETNAPEMVGNMSATFKRILGAKNYPYGHPLYDLGNFREDWLHQHGFRGSLKEIFDAALRAGKETII